SPDSSDIRVTNDLQGLTGGLPQAADLRFWVELRGFEPLTPSMRTRCATGLRHSPWTANQPNRPWVTGTNQIPPGLCSGGPVALHVGPRRVAAGPVPLGDGLAGGGDPVGGAAVVL